MEVSTQHEFRLFTASEANALVPTLQLSFAAIGAIREALETSLSGMGTMPPEEMAGLLRGEQEATAGQAEAIARVQTLIAELGQAVEGLAGLGVIIKDLDPGLVDLPSIREGKLVLLCWQFGEPAVSYFHDVEGGFEERRPLPEAPPLLH